MTTPYLDFCFKFCRCPSCLTVFDLPTGLPKEPLQCDCGWKGIRTDCLAYDDIKPLEKRKRQPVKRDGPKLKRNITLAHAAVKQQRERKEQDFYDNLKPFRLWLGKKI